MQPDIRYFIQFIMASDKPEETIYVNSDRLIEKTKQKYPGTILWEDQLPAMSSYGNTTWAVLNNLESGAYKGNGDSMKQRLPKLTAQSELVLRGHGSVNENRCGAIHADVLARVLLALGLKVSCRINVTGCSLGRNSQTPIANLGTASASDIGTGSFADVLQKALWKEGGLTPAIHARTSNVTVNEDGTKETRTFATVGSDTPSHAHKQPHSKIIFRISDGGAQMMAFAY